MSAGDVRVIRDISFDAAHPRLALDLYLPVQDALAPGTVYFHGGAWRMGTRADHAEERCAGLARRGIAVASASYRLVSEATFPAQDDDAAAAAQWLRTEGARFGIDTTRIGAWGASAGGHLAALLGTGEVLRVDAVAALFPPIYLRERMQRASDVGPSPEAVLLGDADPELVASADPSWRARRGAAPFFLTHGTGDSRIPYAQTERFAAELQAQGTPVTLHPVPDAEHEGAEFDGDAVLDLIAEFFHERLR